MHLRDTTTIVIGAGSDIGKEIAVDDEFTVVGALAEVAVFLAAFPTNALTGPIDRREPWLVDAVTRRAEASAAAWGDLRRAR
jgi:hypothetical protein